MKVTIESHIANGRVVPTHTYDLSVYAVERIDDLCMLLESLHNFEIAEEANE